MLDVLLDVYDTPYLSMATYGVALALVLLAVVAPARSAVVRRAESVSPLWLLVPALVAAALLVFGRQQLLVMTVDGTTIPVLFLIQVVVSVWVLWANRSFPYLVVLSAIVLGWIQWSFFLAVQGAGLRP
jgi:hypothetical protein